jgi:hypothetical protein
LDATLCKKLYEGRHIETSPEETRSGRSNSDTGSVGGTAVARGRFEEKGRGSGGRSLPSDHFWQEPHFSAALHSQREQLAGLAIEQLREATGVAVATVLELMESGSECTRLKAATYVLERVILLSATSPAPYQPDAHDVLRSLGVNCS